MFCWRSPDSSTPGWTWSLCPYASVCVSRASTPKPFHQSLRSYAEPRTRSGPLKTVRAKDSQCQHFYLQWKTAVRMHLFKRLLFFFKCC
ncbi:hypothetical protein P4O66_021527 [Electrophorus voltai]|uniref:Uncharacterized protein n=1 Tax=Electrophorus voltai TaxID=2609070 RepID=A0AAD8ZRL0_9TELE|nr:hypothetical protein P4O66_021527 [Electrophorus voltai]